MTAEIKREDAPVWRQQRSNTVPPMRMRRAAVKQNEGVFAGVTAPVQIMKPESFDLDVLVGRLR
jgi:hypothetical protein